MDETHELLLALAGRVDDDLLAWARELVAVGEDARAVELVTAGLCADRVALPAAVRAATVEAATTARIDLDADAALPPAADDDPGPGHRFTGHHGHEQVAAAVRAVPARLLDGARVQLAWRVTPAGAAPGPLPHPVLLVEVEPGGRPADVLAYQLSATLDRAGVAASVEVLTSGRPLSAYHAAARREARPVDTATGSARAEPVALPVRAEPDIAPAFRDEHTDEVPPTSPVARPLPLRPASEGGRRRRTASDPASGTASRAGEQRRPTVTSISRNALPSPVPLVRREGGGPARPPAPVDPPGEATDQQHAVRPAAEGQVSTPADTPTFRSVQDPLSGPLNAPLLATLLDPTPSAGTDGYEDGREYRGAAFSMRGVSPLAPDANAAVEDGWAGDWASGEWASGDWAVASPADAPDPDFDGDEPEDAPAASAAPEPVPVDAARHRFAGPQPPPLPPLPPLAPTPAAQRQVPEPQRPEPQRPEPQRPEPDRNDLGLRPDSLARLSDADRELLARLQAELGAAGRKPRLTRGASAVPNGNGRPPNLAG